MKPDRLDHRFELRMNAQQARMLQWLAQNQRRSMNDVVRLAIEAVYHRTTMAQGEGRAAGTSIAKGVSR